MSIQIDKNKCVSCGKCCDICPGNLVAKGETGKAYIRCPGECWGCTACLKECQAGAITYYLGADIGGKGGFFYTSNHQDYIDWFFVGRDGRKQQIRVNKQEANKY